MADTRGWVFAGEPPDPVWAYDNSLLDVWRHHHSSTSPLGVDTQHVSLHVEHVDLLCHPCLIAQLYLILLIPILRLFAANPTIAKDYISSVPCISHAIGAIGMHASSSSLPY